MPEMHFYFDKGNKFKLGDDTNSKSVQSDIQIIVEQGPTNNIHVKHPNEIVYEERLKKEREQWETEQNEKERQLREQWDAEQKAKEEEKEIKRRRIVPGNVIPRIEIRRGAYRAYGVSLETGLGLPKGFSQSIPQENDRRRSAESIVYDIDSFLDEHGDERKDDVRGQRGTRDEMREEVMSMLKDPETYLRKLEKVPALNRSLDQRRLVKLAYMTDRYGKTHGSSLSDDIGLDVSSAKETVIPGTRT